MTGYVSLLALSTPADLGAFLLARRLYTESRAEVWLGAAAIWGAPGVTVDQASLGMAGHRPPSFIMATAMRGS